MRSLFPVVVALSVSAHAGIADDIAWHKGDVQSAFDRARREGKPLFLYWGAEWCPPCSQIKKTVFTQREFIDKTKLFIPVYLDGDTESAQAWGERLKTSGYPTMIMMSPQGKEFLRMPTGLQLGEFVSVLDEALHRMTPIGEVLAAALAASDPVAVPDQSYRLLAYYSWGQDESLKLSAAQREERFRKLEARIPARLKKERSRLYTLWLAARIELAEEEATAKSAVRSSAGELSDQERKQARVEAILADPELVIANLAFLEAAAGDAVKSLEPAPGPGRNALMQLWEKTMTAAEANEKLSVDERLSSLLPALDFHQLEKGEKALADTALAERVRKRVRWADENAKDAYTRQAAMSTAGGLLRTAGLKDEARQLYLAQLEKAPSPHYFMSSLADISKEEGKKDEAIDWMRKAYETANGRATRFQWGSSYLIGLMDLAPTDGDRVREESVRVLKEMLSFDDAFAGRNQARIRRLDKKYRDWNQMDVHDAEVEEIRSALQPSCAALSDQRVEGGSDSLRDRCSAFFETLGVTPGDAAAKVPSGG